MAASMAAIISIACHKRYGYRFSSWLLHDGYFSVTSSSKKARQTVDYFGKLDEKVKEYVLSMTKISEELYDQKAGDEFWFGAEEAMEMGVIDEIIGKRTSDM
jgi:ATP-dependent protease ClpP protease subunit